MWKIHIGAKRKRIQRKVASADSWNFRTKDIPIIVTQTEGWIEESISRKQGMITKLVNT